MFASVAGRANLFNYNKYSVAIAINQEFFKCLGMAGGFALAPYCVAGARPVMHLSAFESFFDRFGVHPRHHQHFPRMEILRYGGNKAILREFYLFQYFCDVMFHHSNIFYKSISSNTGTWSEGESQSRASFNMEKLLRAGVRAGVTQI